MYLGQVEDSICAWDGNEDNGELFSSGLIQLTGHI